MANIAGDHLCHDIGISADFLEGHPLTEIILKRVAIGACFLSALMMTLHAFLPAFDNLTMHLAIGMAFAAADSLAQMFFMGIIATVEWDGNTRKAFVALFAFFPMNRIGPGE